MAPSIVGCAPSEEVPLISLLAVHVGIALAADDPFHVDATVETLDNGLVVIVAEDHRTDTVALHLTYDVGARDEAEGEFGAAHLFEHLMFEGSANVPTNMFDEWLTAAGGSNNAYTSDDVTAYHMSFPSGGLDLALFLESDRMGFLDAGLDEANVSNQQSVVLQERAEGYAEPNGRDWDALGILSYPPGHPYHHSVIGTIADVEGFEVDAVRRFWGTHYRPDHGVLALVGNIDTEQALERVRHWFSDVPRPEGERARPTEPLSPALTGQKGVLEDDVEERTLWMAWPAVPRHHPDEAAFDLLANVLSNGRGTRLDDALYYESNLASSVSMFAPFSERAGLFMAIVSSDRTPLKKLDKKVIKAIEGVVKKPPTEAELDRARRAIRGGMLDRMERPEDVAENLADCYRQLGQAVCMGEQWSRYEAVTVDDVVRVAQTYLVGVEPNRLSNVPRGDDGAIEGSVPVELP
jgi:zinc protease